VRVLQGIPDHVGNALAQRDLLGIKGAPGIRVDQLDQALRLAADDERRHQADFTANARQKLLLTGIGLQIEPLDYPGLGD